MSQTIWITGLSGSGKTTLSRLVNASLLEGGRQSRIIDGDELRLGLCTDLGYSRPDRRENIRRAAEVCKLLNEAGVIVIAALVSPYRDDREMAKQIVSPQAFFEVWLSTHLSICEQRDPKGLYQKARAGLIPAFTGISDPYEPPASPRLQLDTNQVSRGECVARIIELLQPPAGLKSNAA